MSCNTKTSLAAVIDEVNAQLNNNYVDRDDPRINQGVFTEPTIRGGLMLDEAAKLDFCGFVQECGLEAPFGKQWLDRPLYPGALLTSVEDGIGAVKAQWKDINDVISLDVTDEEVKTLPIAGALGGGRTQLDKNRENVSIMDFFTEAELAAHKLNPDTFDAHRPVQAFFTYIAANDVGVGNTSGRFMTSKTVSFAPGYESKTKQLVGHMYLRPLHGFVGEAVFHFAPVRCYWHGTINTVIENYAYASQRSDIGVLIGDSTVNASYCYIDKIIAGGNRFFGVLCGHLSTSTHVRSIETYGCGSGTAFPEYCYPVTTLTNRVDNEGGYEQYTELSIDVLPPESYKYAMELRIKVNGKDEIYAIKSVDRVGKKIRIFPILNREVVSSIEATYVFGAGLFVIGGDASVLNFDTVQCTVNSYGVRLAPLYPPSIGAIISEGCMASVGIGRGLDGASLGGSIGYLYTEAVIWDVIINTTGNVSFTINSDAGISTSKLSTMNRYKLAGSNVDTIPLGFEGVRLSENGKSVEFSRRSEPSINFDITDTNGETAIRAALGSNETLINILPPNLNNIDLFGKFIRKIIVYDRNTTDLVSEATVKFVAPSGYLFQNGLDTFSQVGMSGLTEFTLLIQGKKIIVSSDKPLVVSKTLSIPYDSQTLEPNEVASRRFTFSGTEIGDVVTGGLRTTRGGAQMGFEVLANGTVDVVMHNPLDTPITIAASSLTMKVI